MRRFRNREVSVPATVFDAMCAEFDSASIDDDGTCATIAAVYEESETILDPHSAIGVRAARERRRDPSVPIVALATAHPAKFPEAVARAGDLPTPRLPHYMADLLDRAERCTVLPNALAAVQDLIRSRA
jgi:threonine synthase